MVGWALPTVLVAMLAFPSVGWASPTGTVGWAMPTLQEATAAFERARSLEKTDPPAAAEAFRQAAAKFQALIDSGVRNGRLYYNLGNTELQRGRIGAAILNYRRAERFIPGDGRLMENLRFARSLCATQIPQRGRSELLETLCFWHYGTSIRTRFAVGLIGYAGFWAVLIARMFVRRFRLGAVAGALAVIWVALGASVLIQSRVEDRRPAGVVTSADVVVRKGNGESYDPQFQQPLQEGVEFTVIESRGDWMHIELTDGKTGWVRSNQAGLLFAS